MTPISRRTFLASAAAITAAACSDESSGGESATESTTATTAATTTSTSSTSTTTTSLPPIDLPGDPFTLGVASGDPDAESVVLWTRLAPVPLAAGGGMPSGEAVRVVWEVSATADFAELVAVGSEMAIGASGHSVHAIASLPQGKWYYRFRVGQYISPVGLTQPAPADAVAEVRFAAGSCQHYETGHYAAHRDIAEQAPDFMVWLGDYIYEGAGAKDADPQARTHLGPEPTTLEEYRSRYARYKSDVHLQAAHAACPWFVIWDDHEVENNYAGVTPQDADDAAAFSARRFAAYQAWWEHQPVRLPQPATQDEEYRIYRDAQWGDLLTIGLLDGRQYRSDQACGDVVLSLDPPCAEVSEPDRTMLGDEQETWLLDTLTASTAQWKVVGNQVVLANVTLNGAILNYDQWDGYPAARERLLSRVAMAGIENLVVLTGDIHLAAVAGLQSAGQPVGVEFVTTSISSGGNVDPQLADVLGSFPDVIDVELAHRGYSLHTVTPDKWTAEYRIVGDVSSPDSEVTAYRTFVVSSGSTLVAAQSE